MMKMGELPADLSCAWFEIERVNLAGDPSRIDRTFDRENAQPRGILSSVRQR